MEACLWTLKPQGCIRGGRYDQIFQFAVFSFFLSKSLGLKKIYNLHPCVRFFHGEALSYKVSMSRFKIDPNFNIL